MLQNTEDQNGPMLGCRNLKQVLLIELLDDGGVIERIELLTRNKRLDKCLQFCSPEPYHLTF
jgi:hypothetical protein